MSTLTLLCILTITGYLVTAACKVSQLRSHSHRPPLIAYPALASAISAHGLHAYLKIFSNSGVDLGFFNAASLIFWTMTVFSAWSTIRGKAIDNLTAVLYPLAALAAACSNWVSVGTTPQLHWSQGLASHVITSVMAYGVLTVAVLQAFALALQEYALKHRNLRQAINLLPPLQTMENLLFEMLWLGVLLLTASIISGYLFLDDMFAQHLVHKTVFSMGAWLLFAILLWGRHQKGWRGKTAVKWTLWGFLALMMAYFGSKFVLELILHKG